VDPQYYRAVQIAPRQPTQSHTGLYVVLGGAALAAYLLLRKKKR
jgi:hypothetical protein